MVSIARRSCSGSTDPAGRAPGGIRARPTRVSFEPDPSELTYMGMRRPARCGRRGRRRRRTRTVRALARVGARTAPDTRCPKRPPGSGGGGRPARPPVWAGGAPCDSTHRPPASLPACRCRGSRQAFGAGRQQPWTAPRSACACGWGGGERDGGGQSPPRGRYRQLWGRIPVSRRRLPFPTANSGDTLGYPIEDREKNFNPPRDLRTARSALTVSPLTRLQARPLAH